MSTRGVMIGKFMPLHSGHVYMIEFAKNFVDELTVLVDNLPFSMDTMTLESRTALVKKAFPDISVKSIDVPTFQEPYESPVFWDFWRDCIIRNAGFKPDYIIGSMDYVKKLADVIGCDFIITDKSREAFPISATIIRDSIKMYLDGEFDQFKHIKKFIPDVTNEFIVKDIFVVGGESTGKSTTSKAIAKLLGTKVIPEFAIDYIKEHGRDLVQKDLYNIARGQLSLQNTLRKESNIFCINDTDIITTKIWYKKFFGLSGIEFFDDFIKKQKDGFYILLSPDIPWVDESYRYFEGEDERNWFHNEFKKELKFYNKNFIEMNANEVVSYFKNEVKNIYGV